jgi:histidinol-phosphate aminotransferase
LLSTRCAEAAHTSRARAGSAFCNENPLGVTKERVLRVADAIGSMHRYADPSTTQLRAAIATHLGVSPDMVLCANGSDELILLTLLAYVNPGDEVIMANGTFISYYNRTQMMGASKNASRLSTVPMISMPWQRHAPATTVVLICNPNNPTGTTNSAAEMERFLAKVPDDVLVVVDEAYVEYVTRPDFPRYDCRNPQWPQKHAGIRAFAKIYGLAGLRLGYAIADPDMLDYIRPHPSRF